MSDLIVLNSKSVVDEVCKIVGPHEAKVIRSLYHNWAAQVNVNIHDGHMSTAAAEAAAGPAPAVAPPVPFDEDPHV